MQFDEKTRATIGKALGRVPSGIFILTAGHQDRRAGILVSWVQQASFEPPAVSIALGRDRDIGRLIGQGGSLALNIVPQSDTALMKRFARSRDEDSMSDLKLLEVGSAAPLLAGALAWLECRLLSRCDFGGDHEILVAQIVAGGLIGDGAAFVHQRGNGFHY